MTCHNFKIFFSLVVFTSQMLMAAHVKFGLDRVFQDPYKQDLSGKKVSLVTNSSSLSSNGQSACEIFLKHQQEVGFKLSSLFAPEHGLKANLKAFAFVEDEELENLPVYSLHGRTKRPTEEMLKDIDCLIFDLQTVGTRCYTYETTLFYVLEEAAKYNIEVWVLDRPNPMGGQLVTGPTLKPQFKCFFGQAEIPFCHGMTIGELALFFNGEYNLGCNLKVIPMRGWHRDMFYDDTHLTWTAPSPNIPDAQTTLLYPATIILGETLEIVSVDKGGSHPFKRIGAPWINSDELFSYLHNQKLSGISLTQDQFYPKQDKYQGELCYGVRLEVSEPNKLQPIGLQRILTQALLDLYPHKVKEELEKARLKGRKKACNYITGTEDFFRAIEAGKDFSKLLPESHEKPSQSFLGKREKYLLY